MLRLNSLLNYRFGYLSSLIIFIAGFIAGNYFYSLEHASRPNPELIKLRVDNKALANELATTKMNATIEKETNKAMNDTVLRLQSELIEQQLALRFYQKVMAPEFTANGVHIEKVVIEAGISERHYRIEMILAQLEKRKSYLKGKVSLALIGSEKGFPKKIDLAKLLTKKKALQLNFRYFQHLKNEFILPQDFMPEKLKLTINIPRKRNQKAAKVEQEYDWNELLKIPLQPILSNSAE